MSAVTVQAVHGLMPAAEMSRVVGLGVCAAPIEQADFRKPPMVVLVTDTQSVLGDDRHDRTAVIDDEIVRMLASLDHVVAQELSVTLERLADRVEKSDNYGTVEHQARAFRVFVPTEMRWTDLVVELGQLQSANGVVSHAGSMQIDGQVLLLGSDACRHLATQIASKARKVRQTQGGA